MENTQIIQNVISIDLFSEKAVNGGELAKEAKANARIAADQFIDDFFTTDNNYDSFCQSLTAAFKSLDNEGHFGTRGIKVSPNSRKDKVTARMERAARFYHRAFKSRNMGLELKGYNPFKVVEATVKTEKTPMEKLLEAAENLGLDNKGLQEIKYEALAQLARIEQAQEKMKEAARQAAKEEAAKKAEDTKRGFSAAVKRMKALGYSSEDILAELDSVDAA